MTTTEWTVTSCDFEDQGELSKVITRIKARVTASDGTHSTNARTHTFTLAAPGTPFVAFDDIADMTTLMSFVDADDKAEYEAAAVEALTNVVAEAAANKGSGLPSGITG